MSGPVRTSPAVARRCDGLAHRLALAGVHQGTEVDVFAPGITHHQAPEAPDEVVDDDSSVAESGRGRAGSRCSAGPALAQVSDTTSARKASYRSEPGSTSGPRTTALIESVSAPNRRATIQHRRMRSQHPSGGRRTREGHGVTMVEMGEQVDCSPDDQLDRTGRQDVGVHHGAEGPLGHEGRLRGWLDDRGHPGEQRRRELLEHAPDREVEGVDVDRDTGHRAQDVVGGERVVARQAG